MNRPSSKYLFGRTSTFGVSVNVTAEDHARLDAEMDAEAAAERRDREIVKVAIVTPKPNGGAA